VTNPAKYGIGYARRRAGSGQSGPSLLRDRWKSRYTLLGDANLDHEVNGVDSPSWPTNFNKAATAWDQGDFNYDGAVNGTDFALLAANFNQAPGPSGGCDVGPCGTGLVWQRMGF